MRDEKGRYVKGVKKSQSWYRAMEKRRGPGHSLWKGGQKTEMIECECGCGTQMNRYDRQNRARKRVLGHQMRGKRQSEYQKRRMSGPNNHRWVADRSKLKGRHVRGAHDPAYKQWRRSVHIRDGYKCQLVNEACDGRIEVHHILAWRSHPELRYKVNNGITLCHAHHPRGEAEEKRLAPILKQIVQVSDSIKR